MYKTLRGLVPENAGDCRLMPDTAGECLKPA